MYTLSSPTVLASDAAVHTGAVPVLRALSSAFRITHDGATALARAWLARDQDATGIAWGMVELLDLNAPTMPETLRAAGSALKSGAAVGADHLASGRFGNASQVAALVAAEATVWPDAPVATVPGLGATPAAAAAAAASVAAYWAIPELGLEHVRALRAPFSLVALGGSGVFESGPAVYGPRSAPVLELIDRVRTGDLTPAQLSTVSWPAGIWSRAMHEAAWACLREGRLRFQMRAVLDVTLEFALANPALTPVATRAGLAALHAMTVHRLVGDVLDEKPLGELALADLGL
ncbi:hypothetical protein [Kineosporia sp. NBRC 101731]|uniref:hypothetical protein n=1 Tax=Kineosporia sp. NBRC 101731 TaxID=3032199 RepID=UPI0024A020DA|nr:hypothetical protein [Kineosporia sp. NBRC 101731]GLY28808.1 hypothetical protein Kisp02_21730 [Kineosporia sp. NBRC 101731]